MSATALAAYVGTSDTNAFVSTCWSEAVALVAAYVGEAVVPADVLKRAQIEVGAELFHRKSTKLGLAQFAMPDASPVRVLRDPVQAAYPLLARYMGPGVA